MSASSEARSTLEQQRASHALERIRDLQKLDEKQYGHYVSYVSALPATIIMNGLGQALAALVAKAKGKTEDPHRMLFDHVAAWLNRQIEELHVTNGDLTCVIDRLMNADQDTYVQAQAEAMAYINWLKQFARAYLKEQEGESNDG